MPLPERYRNDPADPRQQPGVGPDETPTGGSIAAASATATASTSASAREYDTAPDVSTPEGSVVPFPGNHHPETVTDSETGGSVAARSRTAMSVWFTEAKSTGRSLGDGTVYDTRPVSLRDIAARAQRADWSGGLPLLSLPGRVYAFTVALPTTVLLRTIEQTINRPLRLVTLLAAVLIPLLLA